MIFFIYVLNLFLQQNIQHFIDEILNFFIQNLTQIIKSLPKQKIQYQITKHNHKDLMDAKQQKQTFLYNEIIEKNHDPEQFQQFMFSYKDGCDDLDQWSMAELRDVVQKFKESLKKEKQKSKLKKNPLFFDDDVEDSKEQKQEKSKVSPKKESVQNKKQVIKAESSIVKQSEKKEEKPVVQRIQYTLDQQVSEGRSSRASTIVLKEEGKYLEYDYKSRHEIFSQTLQCVMTTPNTLLTKDIDIKIEKFSKKEGGLFSQAYVCYTVFTPVLGIRVERRYSDFQWLKRTLELLHPGLPVPPIAKKGQFRRYDDKHLWKRVMILEMFLNKLMEIPELKAEVLVENFLKITENGSWQKFKLSFKGLSVPSNLKNLKNMKGKINLSIQPRINTFLARSQKNLTETQPEIKKIYKEFKSAAGMLESCGQTLKGIAKLCDQLNKKDSSFRQKVQLRYCPNNIFTTLADSTTRLAQQLQKQAKTFRQQFHPLLKYESLHMTDILDYFDTLAELQRNFQQSKSALLRKKLKLYEQGNISKWGLSENFSQKPQRTKALEMMLPKQTKELDKLRQRYALYNFQMYEELNRFYSSKNYHIGRYLQQYCRQETRISSEMMMIWVDMETNVIAMRENKFLQKVN